VIDHDRALDLVEELLRATVTDDAAAVEAWWQSARDLATAISPVSCSRWPRSPPWEYS